MDPFDWLLATPPLPEALLNLPAAANAFLVGGALRNALLGMAVSDFDIATPFDPTDLARDFARACGGHWFLLDPGRNQSRVVWHGSAPSPLTFDFAPFRAADLAGDLRGRDFTVNALALSLGSRTLHDPLGGREDLTARLLHDCDPQAFEDDPLRVLRAVRLVLALGFMIEKDTWKRAQNAAHLLAGVAAERRGDEVVRIVNSPGAEEGLVLLLELGTTGCLFGPHRGNEKEWLGSASRVLGRLQAFVAAATDQMSPVAALLDEAVGRSLSRLGRLRLAAILAAGGCDLVQLDERLALGLETKQALKHLLPLVTGAIPLPPKLPGRRARARWAAQEPFVIDRLLLASALTPAGEGREDLLATLEAYLELEEERRIPDLVDGHWIARNLGLAPGPKLGELVAKLRAAELAGAVETPAEARKFLISLREKTIDKKNGKPL